MQKPVFIFVVLALLATNAEAFDHARCLAKSQASPFNMSEKDALAACDAKNRPAGKGKTSNVLYSLDPPENTYSAKAFVKSFNKYLDQGNIRTTICYDGCRVARFTIQTPRCSGSSSWCRSMVTKTILTPLPNCPSGYQLVPNALGDLTLAHSSRLHGPHGRIRTGLCRKN